MNLLEALAAKLGRRKPAPGDEPVIAATPAPGPPEPWSRKHEERDLHELGDA